MNDKIILASNGKTTYRIVTARDAIPAERHAAEELKRFLYEITGADFPLALADEPSKETEIIVGDCSRLKEIGCKIDFSALGCEGFTIKTVGKSMVIAGGKPRGTLYGVYTFLEQHLGCRWFTRDVSRIPRREETVLPLLDETQVPMLEQRDPCNKGNLDPDWHARNKSNSMMLEDLNDTYGYKVDYYPFVHTFNSLVPVEEYFDSHPEYFSEIDGKRVKEHTQLCLTNPDVLKISVAKVKQWIKDHPKISIVSVSQNDWANPCQCEHCRAINEREGSMAGALIEFVNKVAEAIEEEFPNIAIDTLAYQWSRKAPKTLRPRHNVIVRLCSIECCFAHPLSDCDHVASFASRDWCRAGFAQDLIDWGKVCDRLYVWDYTTNFAHYLNPFPDFKVLGPNIRFFVENNVKGIFEEGCMSLGRNGELNELRQYVLAKLLWNPYQDTDVLVNEFLTGVYGMAAVPMREYFDLIHEQVADKDVHMGIYDTPHSSYLNRQMLAKADEIFDRAEMVADNEEILERVRVARLSIRYVELTYIPMIDPDRAELVEEFARDLQKAGFSEIRESLPVEESLDILRRGELKLVNI